jgi:two-component system phosphate regulon response regulator PhoB
MPTIMVVDDDANIRAVLKYRFERENYAVQLATNGLEALRQIDSQCPDLIILDLMMPEMDGLQLLSRLKDTPLTQDIPVIVLTALGRNSYSARTRALGAVGLVVKPFSPRELVREVREALALNGRRSVRKEVISSQHATRIG